MYLFISDLDGTLMNSSMEISERSVSILNKLISRGLNFTIATARSITSCKPLVKNVNLKLPLILMNGIFIYDPVCGEYIVENYLDNKLAENVIIEYEKHGVSPWVFAKDKFGREKIFYKGAVNKCQEIFVNERLKLGDKRFALVDKYPALEGMKIIHINIIEKEKKLNGLYKSISNDVRMCCHYYEDVYNKGFFLMESMSRKATKKNGIIFLREYLDAKKLICFGDNLNDLNMFEAADESYAVDNAHPRLKEAADKIIGSNDEDGVAQCLKKLFS